MNQDLYDTAADVVIKALRGLDRLPGQVAAETGVPLEVLGSFLKGGFSADTARRLAPALGLDADALARFPEVSPEIHLPSEIQRLELPFEDESVNAWAIDTDEVLTVIDAGLGPSDLAGALPPSRRIDLLITHPHRDHIGGIDALRDRIRSIGSPAPLPGAHPVRPGDTLKAGGSQVSVFALAGHHPEAVGYRVSGFAAPVLAVGDAVFARSAGGCPGPKAYQRARATISAAFRDLPGDALLLPGHGPATTLEIERRRNPFLASWLSGGVDGP